MIKTPHPIKGTKTATGDDVESSIKASFSLESFNLLKNGLKIGPTINGVPRSEKNIIIPVK